MVPIIGGRTTGDQESPVAGEKAVGSECKHPKLSAFSPAVVPLARQFCLSFLFELVGGSVQILKKKRSGKACALRERRLPGRVTEPRACSWSG